MPTMPSNEDLQHARERANQTMGTVLHQARAPFLAALGAGDVAANAVGDALHRVRQQISEHSSGKHDHEPPADLAELRAKLRSGELRDLFDAYRESAAELYGYFSDRGEDTLEKLRNQPGVQRARDQVGHAQERVEGVVGDARDLADDVLGKVSTTTRSVGEKAARTTESVADDAAAGVRESAEQVVNAAKDTAESVRGAGKQAASETRSTARKAATAADDAKSSSSTKSTTTSKSQQSSGSSASKARTSSSTKTNSSKQPKPATRQNGES